MVPTREVKMFNSDTNVDTLDAANGSSRGRFGSACRLSRNNCRSLGWRMQCGWTVLPGSMAPLMIRCGSGRTRLPTFDNVSRDSLVVVKPE
jgi:hypothetical protein